MFSQWIEGIVNDPLQAVDKDVFDSVLGFVARHCVGVLHDQVVKSFCILGDDQVKLVKKSKLPLDLKSLPQEDKVIENMKSDIATSTWTQQKTQGLIG